ncbi:cyclodeaminase/cyclohydrolase family protein [Oscillospiraceae bacterium LTW-04]|nr:cyclodeaminase/cyclohydrolase family protein [Oscillospiraceae bacterium MB24-C1]
MDIKAMSLSEFTQRTASKASVPGGGSVAALAGAIAAALSGMVASLTIDKKGYEQHRPEMLNLFERAEVLRARLLDDIERDCTSFDAYIAALALPKETDQQKEARSAALQQALKVASAVPLEVAQTALEIMPLAKLAVQYGNTNAVSDGVISAMMARTAILAALCNVKINLGSIKDADYVAKTAQHVQKLEQVAIQMEKDILAATSF